MAMKRLQALYKQDKETNTLEITEINIKQIPSASRSFLHSIRPFAVDMNENKAVAKKNSDKIIMILQKTSGKETNRDTRYIKSTK